MGLGIENQVAVITGGASGLGFALASRIAKEGAKACLFDLDREVLKSAARRLGTASWTRPVDVTSLGSVERGVAAAMAEFGRIDILVNCAGITGQTNLKSHEVPVDDFDRVLATNLRGTFLACRAVLPHMVVRRYGRILNVASIAGKDGNAGMVAYSASKAGVIGLTKSMGKEYAESGITINAIAPAVIQTALVDRMPKAQVKYMTDRIPMKRCGTLQEFADMAAFIVSPANSFTTGFTFDLSGGRAVY